MCVNEVGSIRLMEEKDVEQVEELEKQTGHRVIPVSAKKIY